MSAPPDPPKPKLPAALGKGRRVCGSSLYTKKTIPFLDGTALDLVFTRDLGEPRSLPMAMDLETAESVLESQCATPAS